MNSPEMNHNSHRLGFMIPLVLFVLFFVLCCGVLVCVFMRSAEETAAAGRIQDCVQLCRNQAELLRSPAAPDPGRDPLWLSFDEHYQTCEPEIAVYRLQITCTEEETPAGILRNHRIEAYATGSKPIYTLETAVYLPGGR